MDWPPSYNAWAVIGWAAQRGRRTLIPVSTSAAVALLDIAVPMLV